MKDGRRIDTTEYEIGERGKLPAAGATRTTKKKNQVGESAKSIRERTEEDTGRRTRIRGGSRGDHSTSSRGPSACRLKTPGERHHASGTSRSPTESHVCDLPHISSPHLSRPFPSRVMVRNVPGSGTVGTGRQVLGWRRGPDPSRPG